MSTMTMTALAVDYPSHRRAEGIISKGGMCICVCGGISTTIFCFSITHSVDYQQIIDGKRTINGLARLCVRREYRSTI